MSERVAFRMRIAAGAEQAYVDAHRPEQIWPSIVDACRRAGLRNYSLFRDGRDVFACFEADDAGAALAALGADPANAPWQQRMAPLMEVAGSFREQQPMRFLEEVWHLP
jgi:L-rhamnose mutarotase